MENDGGYGAFGVHHIAVGKFHADAFGNIKQGKQLGLVLQAGAGGVAEGVAFAPVAGAEQLAQFGIAGGLDRKSVV